MGTTNQLQITNDECTINGDRAESHEPFSCLLNKLDSDLSDFHGVSPLAISPPSPRQYYIMLFQNYQE